MERYGVIMAVLTTWPKVISLDHKVSSPSGENTVLQHISRPYTHFCLQKIHNTSYHLVQNAVSIYVGSKRRMVCLDKTSVLKYNNEMPNTQARESPPVGCLGMSSTNSVNSSHLEAAMLKLMPFMRFKVLTAASNKITAFWETAPCSLVEVGRRFRYAYCLHHRDIHRPDNGGSTHLWNVGLLQREHMALYPRKLWS
jgi:hypothetical protein